MRTDGVRGASVFLDEASVMATENIVMAAALAQGETTIGNAACEPHVQDLCRFLGSLGADIQGIESNVLRVRGVESLRGGEWTIGPDHVEVASFIGLAAVTGGDVTIDGVRNEDLISILPTFARLGVRVEIGDGTVRVPPGQELYIEDDIGGHIPKIEDGPWPAFPSDCTSIALTVATQARGTVLLFEKMFENRLFFTDKLVSMGARIILCDPHRAVVTGPTRLRGQRMESPDIRAGMSMLLASLCAEGESTIGAVYQIDKGYERIDERLRALGARIERVSGLANADRPQPDRGVEVPAAAVDRTEHVAARSEPERPADLAAAAGRRAGEAVPAAVAVNLERDRPVVGRDDRRARAQVHGEAQRPRAACDMAGANERGRACRAGGGAARLRPSARVDRLAARAATAAATSMTPKPSRGFQRPRPDAVAFRTPRPRCAVSAGFAAQTRAAAPATSGWRTTCRSTSRRGPRGSRRAERGHHTREPGRDRAEHVLSGRGERDVGAGVREAGVLARQRAGCDRQPDSALAARAGGLEHGSRILDRVAGRVLVARGRHQQDVVADRVLDRSLLEGDAPMPPRLRLMILAPWSTA